MEVAIGQTHSSRRHPVPNENGPEQVKEGLIAVHFRNAQQLSPARRAQRLLPQNSGVFGQKRTESTLKDQMSNALPTAHLP